jgi:type III pantothenate kinase
MRVLCVDCGNTRLKWGLREGSTWLERRVATLAEFDALQADVERIVACNVGGIPPRLAVEALAARLGVPVEWVRSRAEQCGVVNGYAHPEQLGADRWAALIGARALCRGDCLVVMCGTATTIDVLSADGRFQGGVILPGLSMMHAALAAGTADLPAAQGEYRDLPTNTFDAIATGCLHATVGAIERMARQLPTGAQCLLSGGAAGTGSSRLTLAHRVVENLVLDGLAVIAAIS